MQEYVTCIAEQEQNVQNIQTVRQPQCLQPHRANQKSKLQKALEEKEEAELKRLQAKDQLIEADNVYIRALQNVLKEKDQIIEDKDKTISREEKIIMQVLRLPSIGIPQQLRQQMEECCINRSEDDNASVSSGYLSSS